MNALSKQEYDALHNPCVYLFWLKTKCLYIGMSRHGILRPLTHGHHVKTLMKDFDRLEFRWCKDALEAQKLESKLIKQLSPLHNRVDNRSNYPSSLKRQSHSDKVSYIKRVIEAMYEAGLIGRRK